VGQRARVETVVGSSEYIQAVVKDVALATSSLNQGGPEPAGGASGRVPAELVWVKLEPVEPIAGLLPGMSARSVIRVPW